MNGLRGLRVLVTGAAQGIGWAVAERFAKEGGRVAINDLRDSEALRERVRALPAECGDHAIAIGDISGETEARRVVGEAIAGLGGLDLLVNNAGIQRREPSETVTVADFERVMAVNVRGTFLCSQAAIAHFLASGRGGSIINTTSVHETIPKPNFLSYSASKGAIGNMTRTLALEYAGHGIRVNAVAPGGTDTPLNPGLADPLERTRASLTIPIRRIATADEIAGAFAFLASADASYVTGHTLYVDGGLALYNEFANR